jgi:predicted kinase
VEAAIAHLSPSRPRLIAVGGLSGSGKSTFAREVAGRVGPSPGAVILRTDEIRKRLLGVPPRQRMDPAIYTPEAYVRTYDTLIANARAMLAAGRSVLLDATFIDPLLRGRAEELARDCGVPFHGLWMDAPAEVLEARVAARTGDASDATVAVLRDQLRRVQGMQIPWDRLDATRTAASVAAAWAAGLS